MEYRIRIGMLIGLGLLLIGWSYGYIHYLESQKPVWRTLVYDGLTTQKRTQITKLISSRYTHFWDEGNTLQVKATNHRTLLRFLSVNGLLPSIHYTVRYNQTP